MRPIVTLTTHLGAGRYPAQIKANVLSICSDANIVDVTHDLAPGDAAGAALLLADVARNFPRGTVHLVVADAGLGAKNRGMVVKAGWFAEGQYLVGSDNGALAQFADGGEVRLLNDAEYQGTPISQVFHGRDIYAPAAAHLCNGVAFEHMGPLMQDWQRLKLPEPLSVGPMVIGEVLYADRFGNVVTNVERRHLPQAPPERLRFELGSLKVGRLASSYADVRIGDLVALIGVTGRLEIAEREGNAAARLRMEDLRGLRVTVSVGSSSYLDP
jgi:S-adenosylmethionine hydrolase